jgi:hypothetical protein
MHTARPAVEASSPRCIRHARRSKPHPRGAYGTPGGRSLIPAVHTVRPAVEASSPRWIRYARRSKPHPRGAYGTPGGRSLIPAVHTARPAVEASSPRCVPSARRSKPHPRGAYRPPGGRSLIPAVHTVRPAVEASSPRYIPYAQRYQAQHRASHGTRARITAGRRAWKPVAAQVRRSIMWRRSTTEPRPRRTRRTDRSPEGDPGRRYGFDGGSASGFSSSAPAPSQPLRR